MKPGFATCAGVFLLLLSSCVTRNDWYRPISVGDGYTPVDYEYRILEGDPLDRALAMLRDTEFVILNQATLDRPH